MLFKNQKQRDFGLKQNNTKETIVKNPNSFCRNSHWKQLQKLKNWVISAFSSFLDKNKSKVDNTVLSLV